MEKKVCSLKRTCKLLFIIIVSLSFTTTKMKAQFTEQFSGTFPDYNNGTAVWGDYDNDGKLDVLVSGSDNTTCYTKLYHNTGSGFAEVFPGTFIGMISTSVWCDFNNDGLLDIVTSGREASLTFATHCYKNTGNGFIEVYNGSIIGAGRAVSCGDYNNDGLVDILVSGNDATSYRVKLYKNTGSGFIEVFPGVFTALSSGNYDFGDYDNDGDLDIVCTGEPSTLSTVTKIYRNDGTTFTEVNAGQIVGISRGNVKWGDYDNDGDLDVLITGRGPSGAVTKVYRNDNGVFTELTGSTFKGLEYSYAAWGDYDGDGDLDIFVTGYDGSSSSFTKVYQNTGSGFSEVFANTITGKSYGFIGLGDYDNDGDLDLMMLGSEGNGTLKKIQLYRNGLNTNPTSWGSNAAPTVPTGLISSVLNENVILKWNKAADNTTPSKTLTYNLRIGTAPGKSNIVGTMANDTVSKANCGFRRIVGMGNSQLDTTFVFRTLNKGIYYWSVQALDNNFAGSVFANEQNFTIADIQASQLTFSNVQAKSLKLKWWRGNGDNCVVFAKENGAGIALPVNNTTYTANTSYGSGTQIGTSGWYCVYNGNKDTITLSNLKVNTSYRLQVIEYNGLPGNETYITNLGTNNPTTQITNQFSEQNISLTGVKYSSIVWGDYDNDGYLDMLVTGSSTSGKVSKIFKNNGNNTFTEQTGISLIGVDEGAAAWGDYNNDGYLDILLVGYSASVPVSKIYKNNGNNTFTDQTSILLTGIMNGSAAWGDYNNDGLLDILLSGNAGSAYVTKIYKNNGNNTFSEQTGMSISYEPDAMVAWGDYNNDGLLDILLTGSIGGTKLYKNNGDNSFTEQTGISIPQAYMGSVAWGDYDNDGKLDILLTGSSSGNKISKVFHNNGNGNFTEVTGIALANAWYSKAVWGDYDNDGDLDILLEGNIGTTRVTKIYKNNGDNTFTEQTSLSFPGLDNGSSSFVDYDNDGDLDILLNGTDGTNNITKLYRNDITTSNVLPTAPSGMVSTLNGNDLILSWNPVKTDATFYKSISYNVRVGTTSGASNIVSPQAANSGFRRVPVMGNGQLDTSFVLKSLKKGTYYWSAQAIDNDFAGGAFSTEQQFVYNIDVQSSMVKTSNVNSSSFRLQWIRGNGDKCIVFAKENGTGLPTPVNSTTYTANASYGLGSQIGTSGWYCIYNGDKDTVNFTNLKSNTAYRIHVVEYTGAAGAEVYYASNGTNNPVSQITNLFTEQNISLTGLYQSSAVWGDYNNDGYLDAIITGNNSSSYTKIYKNNGDNSFTEQTAISLTGVSNGSVAWGDYNNDGYLDILLTGYSSTGGVSKVYKNNGNNTFTEQTGIVLTGLYTGSVAWGDYNNDGLLDILLSGSTGSTNYSKIYKNNGDNTFTEQTGIALTGVSYSSVAWGDYDNDGKLDILLTGNSSTGSVSKIYKNNGDGSFTEQTGILLTGIYRGSVAWGDYDNDGKLDILLTGSPSTVGISKVYKNNGNNSFTEQTGIVLTGVYYSSAAWGDIDNDGNLDILIAGNSGTSKISKVYRNNGNNTFTEFTNIPFPGVENSSLSLGDYDKDGDLDVLLTGNVGGTYISKIYRNDVGTTNIVPDAPSGLTSTVNGTDITLKWNPVKTDATSHKSISYNVKVGSTSGGEDIISSQSASNGYRKISAMGNGQLDTTFVLKITKRGTYYWNVQALDNAYAGGPFAGQQSFVMNTEIQSSSLIFTSINANSLKLKWTSGNGDKRLVFVKENGNGTALPINNTAYTANTSFGQGTQIGTSGWYCVYNGDKDTVTIINLKANTEYRFQVIDYAGIAGSESYFTSTGIQNPVQYVPSFIEQTQLSLTSVSGSLEAWADYNNDGFLDLLIAGNDGSSTVAKLYKNNGDGTFTVVSTAIFDVSGTTYDAKWCDYDNDGDMDLLIAGLPSSKLYENNGDGTFTSKATLSSIFMGKCAWADFDNDGFKDIIMTGSGGTKVLKNNHDGTFTAQTNTLPSVANYSSVACADYDNDGDADILLAGFDNNASVEVTKVYRNDGNFIFTEQTGIVLPGISNCSVAWADMDADGDLDIIISGAAYNFYNKIYENKGSNTFAEMTTAVFKQLYRSSMAIGDYDNNGYPDILLSGSYNGSDYYTILYKNNGNKTFTEVKEIAFDGVQNGSAQFGDYDKDGDLDLFLCGSSASGRIAKIFKNNLSTANIAPSAPSGLITTLNGNNVILKWSKAADDKTSQTGLSYNIYLYETSKPGYRKGPSAFNQSNVLNGLRLISSFGDVQYNANGYVVNGLPVGNYKWSIQAVDAGLKGSPFATELSFSILDLTGVAVNVASNQLNGTSTSMQYSLNSTDGSNGSWTNCSSPYTTVNYNTGGFDVWVRQSGNNLNNRRVTSISVPAASPTFTINYSAETTTEAIADTILYSTVASMSSTTTGTGTKVSISPGQNLYFRVKASATKVASAIQTLLVPGRPAAPAYMVDYISETTSAIVPVADEYSLTSGMSSVTGGAGAKITLTPGQNIYFRTKASDIAFKSLVQTLTVPSRPAAPVYLVDYINETTSTIVPATDEYSLTTGMGSVTNGVGAKITLTPGQNVYFRTKASGIAFKSLVQTLTIANRPVAPAFTADDVNKTTNENIPATVEYSTNADMSGAQNGTGTKVAIPSGQSIYLRTKATSSSFKSQVQTLSVSAILPEFSEQFTGSFPNYAFGFAVWGDYNKDGLLDFITCGDDGTNYFTKLFRNTGNGFTEAYPGTFTGIVGSLTWCDFNNDGSLDLIISGREYSGIYATHLYKNIGTGFTEVYQGTVWGATGHIACGDYNNDGRIDLIIGGDDGLDYKTKLYKNTGSGFVEDYAGTFTGLTACFFEWGDYDNDGDLDLLCTGQSKVSTYVTKLYRNNGNGFTEVLTNLPGINRGFVRWGDYDNDGDLDILMGGRTSGSPVTEIYRNDGAGVFAEQTSVSLYGLEYSRGIWADYNNDGLLDIFVTGYTGSTYTKLYKNTGSGFTEVTTNIKGKCYGYLSAGDYDNDGDLDLILIGSEGDGSSRKVQLYRNNMNNSSSAWTANSAPNVIANLATTMVSSVGSNSNKDVTITWDKATDTQTSQDGLTYNLYVYQEGQANFKLAPDAFLQTSANNGLRLIAKIGNIRYNQHGYTLKGLPVGNYKWSVQAIDGGLMGGSFTEEASFTILPTGISSISAEGIKTYPNPAKDELFIEGISQKSTVTIYTVDGYLVKSMEVFDKKEKVDVSALSSGLFVMKINNPNSHVEIKFIKQ